MENETLTVIAKRSWKGETFFLWNEAYSLIAGYACIIAANWVSNPIVSGVLICLGILCFLLYIASKWWSAKQNKANTFRKEFSVANSGLVASLQQSEQDITGVDIIEAHRTYQSRTH